MVDPSREDHPPDQLSGGAAGRGRRATVAIVTVVALAGGGIALARAAHHPSGPAGSERDGSGRTVSNQAVQKPPERHHSLFLSPVPTCLRTDRRQLTLALDVTNLGDGRLRLVDVFDLTDGSGPRLVAWTPGARPCGSPPAEPPTVLADGDKVVVSLDYRLSADCPQQARLHVRLLFRAGRSLLHVDSSQLADLRRVAFAQCGT